MAIIVKNANAFSQKIAAEKRRIKSTATEYVRSYVFRMYKFAVDSTPQYSGTTVSGWSLQTNLITPAMPSRKPADWVTLEGVVLTSSEFNRNKAIEIAHAREQIATLKYNTKIKLVNNSPDVDELIAGKATDWRDINYELVKNSQDVLMAHWNIRSVMLLKFSMLERGASRADVSSRALRP